MPKPFDATLKQLLDLFAIDWIDWLAPQLGLPGSVEVEPIDVELSTVQFSADKVFRLRPPAVGLLHFEPQASWDGDLPNRLLLYNALLDDKYGGPVYSVAILLRPEANASSLTGTLSRVHADGSEYLRFRYSTIRIWEQKADDLFAMGFGTLPLALLADDAKDRLKELVDRLDVRLRDPDVPDSKRRLILTSSYILLGLRYNDTIIKAAFVGAMAMKESSTYQAILKEGREEGREEGQQALRDTLLDILGTRFGKLPVELVEAVAFVTDLAELRSAIHNAATAASLDKFHLG